MVGSCFSEQIGERLQAHKFSVQINPSGILYNPISIARLLERLLDRARPISPNDIFFRQGLWRSWEHHSRYAHPDRDVLERQLVESHREAATFAVSATWLLVTLGTADVFMRRSDGAVVANNHKMPAAYFEQRRLSVDETVGALSAAFEKWRAIRPHLQVLLTVSPVRHLRNGFVENQRSKAVLLLACAQLCETFPFVHYFPAYELLIDDLRDYRFYAADMVHPSDTAVDYIWEYFAQALFTPHTQQLVAQIAQIRAAAAHRPFHPQTPEHKAFAQQQYDTIQQLLRQHPYLDFSEEMAHFRTFLST